MHPMRRRLPLDLIRWIAAIAALAVLPVAPNSPKVYGDELPSEVMSEVGLILSEIPIFLEEGKTREVRELLKRLEELQEPLARDHPFVVLNDLSIATLLARNGFLEEAKAPLGRLLSVDILKVALFPEDPERATKLTEIAQFTFFLGMLYIRGSDLPTAIACLEKALAYQEVLLSPGHPDLVRTLHTLGRAHWEAKQPGPAHDYLSRAAQALKADSGYEDAATVFDDLSKLAELEGVPAEGAHGEASNAVMDVLRRAHELYREGEFTQAVMTRVQAAKLFSDTLGPHHFIPLTEYLEAALWSALHESLADARLLAKPALYDGDLVKRVRRASPDVPRAELGEQLARMADLLEKLSVLSFNARHPGEARTYAEQALSIREEVLGVHDDTARILQTLGWALHFLGELDKARAVLARSLEMYERLYGTLHERTVAGLEDLATMCFQQNDLPASRSHYERALGLRRLLYRDAPEEIAAGMVNVGDVALEMGDFPGAEELLESAHDILERRGLRGESMARTLTSQGTLLHLEGDFRGARQRLEEARALAEEILDPEDPHLADLLAQLGHIYVEMGEMVKAQAAYERALSIHTAALGERSHRTANSLNGLGILLSRMGDDSRAISYLQRALNAFESTLGRDHPRTLNAMNALAFAWVRTGNAERALPLLEEATRRGTAVFEEDDPRMALILVSSAMAQHLSGDAETARARMDRATAILKNVHGRTHPFYAYSIADIGWQLRQMDDAEGAIPLYRESLRNLRESLGGDHYRVAEVALELSSTLLTADSKEHSQEIVRLTREALAIQEAFVSSSLFLGSDADKSLFLRSFNPGYPVALHLGFLPRSREVSHLALETILRHKGRALDATVESLRTLRQRLRGEDLELVQSLERHRGTRAQVIWLPSALMSNTRRRLELESVDARIHEIESQLALRTAELELTPTPIRLDEVRARLTSHEVLIEFFVYSPQAARAKPFHPSRASRHYAAYVLHPTGEIHGVDLGPADAIDDAARAFHQSLATSSPEFRTDSRHLEALTMAGLRPFLGAARELLISPDGYLNLVPFAAMVGETGRYLVEDHAITYVSSGRDLLRWDPGARHRQEPLLAGGISYDASPDDLCSRDDDLGHEGLWRLEQLESTAGEVEAIGDLFGLRGERILTGAQATEAAVKAVKGPLFLHLATHGFFLEARQLDFFPDPVELGLESFARPENALLLSGVALRGFNQRNRAMGPNDGVLTALEVKDLDLWGTEVAVLSACETGLGLLQDQHGVFGLRRALVLAGAKTQVIALWKVADEPTKNLMVSWYAQLEKGVGRAEAMRRVQLAALSGEPLPVTESFVRGVRPVHCSADTDSSHPYYWASFIVSGEKGPLPGPAEMRGGERRGSRP